MSSTEFDAYTLVNAGDNVQYFKELSEKLFALEQDLKRQLDAGLAPDAYKQAALEQHAVETAAEICQLLQA